MKSCGVDILGMIKPWDKFFQEKLLKIFTEKKVILDIGGGLRTSLSRGNRLEEKNAWLEDYVKKVDYKVLDKVSDYHPDIVGDVQQLPMPDASVEAVICIAVLEHVEEPQKAVKEMYRVLKPGGFC
ncbi:MAG: methyltransferase domain-containing protein, partial [Patescibacteria group bacterium]